MAYRAGMGPFEQVEIGLSVIQGWLDEKDYHQAGPSGRIFITPPWEVDPEEHRWEAYVTVDDWIDPEEPDSQGIGVKVLDSAQVASTLHSGPLEDLRDLYSLLLVWIKENSYQIVGHAEELYLSEPSLTAQDDLLSEFRMPVQKRV